MGNILSDIQNFFVVVVTTLASFVLIVSPLKPQAHVTPTPTPLQVYKNQKATSSSKVLGVTQVPKDNKENKNNQARGVVLPTTIPTPTPIPTQPTIYIQSNYSTPPPMISSAPVPPQVIQRVIKTDYSSYRAALQATLDSLKNRLFTIQTQADRIPQDADNQLNAISTRLASDLLALEGVYNQSTTNLSREFGRRGIPSSSGLFQDELRSLTDSYNNSRNGLISQADQDTQQVYTDAKNKIYQADAQDKDLSNKIIIVESLINKINAGIFTDSDIPLAIQAMSY